MDRKIEVGTTRDNPGQPGTEAGTVPGRVVGTGQVLIVVPVPTPRHELV